MVDDYEIDEGEVRFKKLGALIKDNVDLLQELVQVLDYKNKRVEFE
jgi:hypothetical protein